MKINRLGYLTNQFFLYMRKEDYFHMDQPIGLHFKDQRCYYNDLRAKADWKGPFIDGVPALYIAESDKYVISPCMVLLYALGCVDRYLIEKQETHLIKIQKAISWLSQNIEPLGYWKDNTITIEREQLLYSKNSAMNQGLALSFFIRIINNSLTSKDTVGKLNSLVDKIALNMIHPIDKGGTALLEKGDLAFCEYCDKNKTIVFNGWIYAIFGLYDYSGYSNNVIFKDYLAKTIGTLIKFLPMFKLKNGWTYYDNKKRINSPFYHNLHISLFEALFILTNNKIFMHYQLDAIRANTALNRFLYTFNKIKDKIID